MSSINPLSMSSWLTSQSLAAPAGINPNSWVVAVKLQNGQTKYNQFATQAQALQDIQAHNFGVLIAPQNPSAAARAPQTPAAPAAYVSPLPAVAYSTWMSSRSIAPNITIQPTFWTVEVQSARGWTQFRTEQEADAYIQRNGSGFKIAPLNVQPRMNSGYTPILVQQQSTPQPPAPSASPVSQTPPVSPAAPAVKVKSLLVSQINGVTRGTLSASVQAIKGGCRISVKTNHSGTSDSVTYNLLVQRGGYFTQAAVLAQSVPIAGLQGDIVFDVDYAKLSAQIGVPVAAGMAAEIGGTWQTGHQWGQNSGGRPGGAIVLP